MKIKFKGTIEELKDYGFEIATECLYPKKMKKGDICIGISPPNINMWDYEDKADSFIFSKITKKQYHRIFLTYNVKEDLKFIPANLLEEVREFGEENEKKQPG